MRLTRPFNRARWWAITVVAKVRPIRANVQGLTAFSNRESASVSE